MNTELVQLIIPCFNNYSGMSFSFLQLEAVEKIICCLVTKSNWDLCPLVCAELLQLEKKSICAAETIALSWQRVPSFFDSFHWLRSDERLMKCLFLIYFCL